MQQQTGLPNQVDALWQQLCRKNGRSPYAPTILQLHSIGSPGQTQVSDDRALIALLSSKDSNRDQRKWSPAWLRS
jgi:hypothetical protein